MTSPLTRTLRAYAADARSAFSAAPVEVALGVLLATALSAEARSKGFTEQEFARLAASVALALPLVFALSVLRARGVVSAAVRWGGTVAILAACAAFGAAALHDDRSADWWRWALLGAAAVMLLVLTAALPRRGRDRRQEWVFAWRVVVRLVGVGLYSVALFGMLAGAVAAVVSLFDLSKPDHLYTDLAGAVFFAFAPWIFVGGIHRLSAPAPEGVPEPVSRLGRWLYAPVLVVYLLVLYAYAARVLITGELPRNLVSPLVIAAGLIGMVGAVLLEPVHADEEHRGLSMLVRAVPALLLPLVPLAAWALLARLGDAGVAARCGFHRGADGRRDAPAVAAGRGRGGGCGRMARVRRPRPAAADGGGWPAVRVGWARDVLRRRRAAATARRVRLRARSAAGDEHRPRSGTRHSRAGHAGRRHRRGPRRAAALIRSGKRTGLTRSQRSQRSFLVPFPPLSRAEA